MKRIIKKRKTITAPELRKSDGHQSLVDEVEVIEFSADASRSKCPIVTFVLKHKSDFMDRETKRQIQLNMPMTLTMLKEI
ncbi:hypothetical protein MTP04_37350 [Lysinibacillus sp. PLM2]|nr:hypothetical protein MTP04_37350 [Lysinibacillus sp. PLM2]